MYLPRGPHGGNGDEGSMAGWRVRCRDALSFCGLREARLLVTVSGWDASEMRLGRGEPFKAGGRKKEESQSRRPRHAPP